VRRMGEASAQPIGDLLSIQTDCGDPERLAAFWGAVLGVGEDFRLGDPPHYIDLLPTAPGRPALCFQRVPEPKVIKNRLHFDVIVDDLDGATGRVESLGGKRVPNGDHHEYSYTWRIMADPEGNEFCLIEKSEAAEMDTNQA
jgi:predicted enzyme related to lactoylglutathione lyase